MGWIIPVLFAGFFAWIFLANWDEEGPGVAAVLGLIFAPILAFVVGLLGAGLSADIRATERVLDTAVEHELVTLQDQFGQEGEFQGGLFFSSGYIDSKLYFAWYEKQDDGSYRNESVKEDENNEIKVWEEPKGTPPSVTENIYNCEGETAEGWRPYHFTSTTEACETVWELHVPEGTIVRDLKLDAK
jgi:hypothetical protein